MTESDQNKTLSHMISPYSISVYGDAAGHGDVSDSALVALSYDVTYKLYEILRECKTEMNVYRQTSLSNIILSNVFENYGIPPMLGNKAHVPFIKVPNTDMSILQLSRIDLIAEAANETVNVELEPVPYIKGLYVPPMPKMEGIVSVEKIKTEPKSDPDEPESADKTLGSTFVQSLSKVETDYFLVVSQVILSSSENLFKILLEDLRTNSHLGGVYCTLLSFVENSLKYFKCVGKLVDRLLRTIEALLDNPYNDPSSSTSVDDGIHALNTLILESKIASDCDDFFYRRRASYLLMRALNTWNISLEERNNILNTLDRTLKSPEKMSLKLNYSILTMFYGLGCDILDSHFWPFLENYLNVLSSLDEIISGKRSCSLTTDICCVKSALLLVSGILYRNFWVQNECIQALHLRVDALLSAYFGESIHPVRIYGLSKSSCVFISNLREKSSSDEPAFDVRKNYRKIQLSALCRKYPVRRIPIKSTSYRHNIEDVFEISMLRNWNTMISFNFIGSNQLSREQLKRNKLDQRYNLQCQKPSRPFLKYERITRCIKYCKTRASCVGDIQLSI